MQNLIDIHTSLNSKKKKLFHFNIGVFYVELQPKY